jgi:hypothetical protein
MPQADAASVLNASDYQRIIDGVKALQDVGVGLSQWAILLVGGALVVMLSTSYRRPRKPYRFGYLLLLPAVGCLATSLFKGSYLTRVYAGLLLRRRTVDSAAAAIDQANDALAAQMFWFEFALVLLGIWLLLYIVWWVFIDEPAAVDTGAS